MLVSVIKNMNRREFENIQTNITQFFEESVKIEVNKSFANGVLTFKRRMKKNKRMTIALSRLHARVKNRTKSENEKEKEHGKSTIINRSSSTSQNHDEKSTKAVDKSQSMTKRKSRTFKKRSIKDSPLFEKSQDDDEDDYAAPKRSRKNAGGKKSRNEKAIE